MSRLGIVLGERSREGSRATATLLFFAWSLAFISVVVATTFFSASGAKTQFAALAMLVLLAGGLSLWSALDTRFDRINLYAIVGLLVVSRLVALLATPLLEDDYFRYLWDGFVMATTGQPYAFPPSHFFGDANVPSAMQTALNGINHPDIPTIYGVVWQWLFAASYVIAPGALWPIKLTLLAAEIGVVVMLSRNGVPHRWLLCWIAHPLVLQESAFSAHPDVLIGAALLAATLCWHDGRERSAAALAAMAVAMKASALIVLPLFLIRKNGRIGFDLASVSVATVFFLYLPIIVNASASELNALSAFGQQWTFNPLLFKLFSWFIGDSAARVFVAVLLVLTAIMVALRHLAALRAYALMPLSQFTVKPDDSPPIATPILVITFALLMLSPAINPWYWLWVLPIALFRRDRLSLLCWVAASASLLSYSHAIDAAMVNSSAFGFRVPLWATLAQLACIAAAAYVLFRRKHA
jgi:alpha-1,6-mannosyltransferase